MVKKNVTLLFACLIMVSFVALCLAEEKKKPAAAKGQIILNQEKNYVKVLTKDYKTVTVYLDKDTKVEAIVKATIKDLAKDQTKLPGGTVTYTMKDGKAVAKKITYKARAKWAIEKKKK